MLCKSDIRRFASSTFLQQYGGGAPHSIGAGQIRPKLRIDWIDDERRGLTNRKLAKPEDALGAEGRIGDMHLRFERILDLGRNQVVFALYCPEKNIRLAYGFARAIFDPTYKRLM
jgi:hypothetical protein